VVSLAGRSPVAPALYQPRRQAVSAMSESTGTEYTDTGCVCL
jgi:hypothetical protein